MNTEYQKIVTNVEQAKTEMLRLLLCDNAIDPAVLDASLKRQSQTLNGVLIEKSAFIKQNPGVDKVEFMIDRQGFEIPINKIKQVEIDKDSVVNTLIAQAKQLSKLSADFKRYAFSQMLKLKENIFHQYDVDVGGEKGNLTVPSYNNKLRVVVGIADQMSLGPEIAVARKSIAKVTAAELEGTESKLLTAITNEAFATNEQGQYNKARLLQLKKYKDLSDNPDWQTAMQALDDAMITGDSKTYIRFYERDRQGGWVQIPLTSKSL